MLFNVYWRSLALFGATREPTQAENLKEKARNAFNEMMGRNNFWTLQGLK